MTNPTTTTARKLCPITLEQFKAAAPSLYVSFDRGDLAADYVLYVSPKAFSTGSIGLWGQDKIQPKIGGCRCPARSGEHAPLRLRDARRRCATRRSPSSRDAPRPSTSWPRDRTRPKGDGVKARDHQGPLLHRELRVERLRQARDHRRPLSGDMLQVGINVTAAGSKPAAPAASA